MAARLVKVESLIATLQSVLDDLDASMGVWVTPSIEPTLGEMLDDPGIRLLMGIWVTPGIGAEQEADNCSNDTSGHDAQRIARRHIQFVEGMLETALSKIHAGVESVGEHPIWESEQRFDAHVRGTKRDTNDKSRVRKERRA